MSQRKGTKIPKVGAPKQSSPICPSYVCKNLQQKMKRTYIMQCVDTGKNAKGKRTNKVKTKALGWICLECGTHRLDVK